MDTKMRQFFQFIDRFSEKAGVAASLLSLVLMFLIVASVVMRYALNMSFIWSFPLSRQIFGVFILFAAVYAMVTDSHLRVEILYGRISPRLRLGADVIDLLAFLIFIGVLIWQSGWSAQNSVLNHELSQGTPKIPLYIIKSFIPVVSFVLLLEGISFFYRSRIKALEKGTAKELAKTPAEKVETT
jgi:TRAP-type mannitol/chloroaromatic compound transport system permease small subunit